MTTSARYRARDASRAEPAGWASNVVRPPVRISAVVPALNEAPNLEHVLTRMPRCVDEVVLVDGHSIDDTIAVARMLRPDIRVLTQCGVGKGDALACGFAAATGDIIVMLDADGSTDPQEIPQFLDVLLAGADFAKGSRFLAGGGSRDLTWLRTTGNAALCRVVNLLFGTRYTDLCYGYNAFWRHCLSEISVVGDGFEVETCINLRVARSRLRVAEVSSYEYERIHGASNLRPFRDGLRVLRTIIRERPRSAATGEKPNGWRPEFQELPVAREVAREPRQGTFDDRVRDEYRRRRSHLGRRGRDGRGLQSWRRVEERLRAEAPLRKSRAELLGWAGAFTSVAGVMRLLAARDLRQRRAAGLPLDQETSGDRAKRRLEHEPGHGFRRHRGSIRVGQAPLPRIDHGFQRHRGPISVGWAALPQIDEEAAASGSRTALTAWAGVGASIAAAVLLLAAPSPGLALAGALLLACVPAGAGVMCWLDSGEDVAQAALTFVLSLSLFAIASAVMIWLAAWHPRALLAFAAASVVSCLARLMRGGQPKAPRLGAGPEGGACQVR